MTEPGEIDQASLDRIARLQQRRQARPAATQGRRPHAAAGGRILAAGLGASTMFGITAVLALEAAAQPSEKPVIAATASTTSLPPLPTAAPVTEIRGALPPGFTAADIDLAAIPEGGVLTGELTDDGRPVVVVFHPRTAAQPTTPATSASSTAPAVAPAAPTALTATPVVTEVAVPAPASAPAPAPVTRGS